MNKEGCNNCNGSGSVTGYKRISETEHEPIEEACPACGGLGYTESTPEPLKEDWRVRLKKIDGGDAQGFFTCDHKDLEAFISELLVEQLDKIAEYEGWEDNRDFHASRLGFKHKYTDRFHFKTSNLTNPD